MKNQLFASHIKLHIVVLIYGVTAILGKLIQLPAHQLVGYRMAIATFAFLIYILIKGYRFLLPGKEIFKLLGIGMIVAIHWITFFGAVKLSNVSVTLGCLSTATLFTSLLEPFFFRRRINVMEVFVGLAIIGGLYLIFRFEMRYAIGVIVALISAFLAGLFTVLNKKMTVRQNAAVISFYEMLGGCFLISFYLLFFREPGELIQVPSMVDFVYLIVLGIICTAFAFAIQVDIMKHLSAYTVALTINLEPVYGILMAYFLFGESEKMTGGFYTGTAIILLSVVGFPLYNLYVFSRQRPDKITSGN